MIKYSQETRSELTRISQKLDVDIPTILRGWPFREISLMDVWDILSVYHELGLRLPDRDKLMQWSLAGNIVARIQRDRRER